MKKKKKKKTGRESRRRRKMSKEQIKFEVLYTKGYYRKLDFDI